MTVNIGRSFVAQNERTTHFKRKKIDVNWFEDLGLCDTSNFVRDELNVVWCNVQIGLE